jgi:F0F1-type ATP synthase assembly protein I
MYLTLKVLISALIVVAVSEIAKRSTLFGALVASLPLTSILALIWLYQDTKDVNRVATLSGEILWLVIPSLILFIALPLLLKRGVAFYPALGAAAVCTALGYFAMSMLMRRIGVQI